MDIRLIGFLPILPLLKYIHGYDLTWEQIIDHAKRHEKSTRVYNNYRSNCVNKQRDNSKRLNRRIHK